jgi:hypothetical protein
MASLSSGDLVQSDNTTLIRASVENAQLLRYINIVENAQLLRGRPWSGTGNKEHWYLINHYLFSLGTVQTTDCRLTPGLEVHVVKVDKCKS